MVRETEARRPEGDQGSSTQKQEPFGVNMVGLLVKVVLSSMASRPVYLVLLSSEQ